MKPRPLKCLACDGTGFIDTEPFEEHRRLTFERGEYVMFYLKGKRILITEHETFDVPEKDGER